MSNVLFLPAIRGRVGDWAYYVAVMRFSDVKERVNLAKEIHTSDTLNEFIQRRVTQRSAAIADYLVEQPQRFLGALVVGVYGGSPDWLELSIGRNPVLEGVEIPDDVEGALGVLVLQGEERLFALDGQHRLAGIRDALERQPELAHESVSAVFVGHRTDPAGMTRTRRLFTTLNRYARPISALDKIAMDEDDVVAITTRRMVDNYPLFGGRIPSLQTKPIPARDRTSITTLASLYDSLNVYLKPPKTSSASWSRRKRFRPSEEELDAAYSRATGLFDGLASALEPLRLLASGAPTEDVVPRYRNQEIGGHLVLRPIGLELIVRTVYALESHGLSLVAAVDRIAAVPMSLSEDPWVGLLWDQSARRMNTSPESKRLALWILLFGAGGELEWLGRTVTRQRAERELAGARFPDQPDHPPIPLQRYGRSKGGSN